MCTEIVFNCNVRVVKHKVSPMAVHGSDILALRQNFVVGHKKWIFVFGILCRFQKIAKNKVL